MKRVNSTGSGHHLPGRTSCARYAATAIYSKIHSRHGRLAASRARFVDIALSRRSVRRHNVMCARAFIAVRTDEVTSLLP